MKSRFVLLLFIALLMLDSVCSYRIHRLGVYKRFRVVLPYLAYNLYCPQLETDRNVTWELSCIYVYVVYLYLHLWSVLCQDERVAAADCVIVRHAIRIFRGTKRFVAI